MPCFRKGPGQFVMASFHVSFDSFTDIDLVRIIFDCDAFDEAVCQDFRFYRITIILRVVVRSPAFIL